MSSDVTMLGEMEKVVGHLRSSYNQGVTQSYEWRIAQMQGVLNLIKNHKQELIEVLAKDGGKSVFEADLFEVTPIAAEAETVIANLKSWMAPTKVETPIILLPGSNEVHHESYGVILVIAPYNYPLQLACVPMLSALAAGNCVLLKPSEMTPHTSALLAKLIPQYLDPRAIQVVLGGIPETTAILAQRFDMIFFTGSAHVGKIVHQAAAKHLTPCVLELGGKTPVIVDKTVTDLKLAARRLMWGKMANAGQTCIAPDYVLIHKDIRREFVDLCVEWVKDFYTETPKKCTDFARVNNRRTVERLKSLLDEPEKIVFGGDVDADELYVAPTLIDNVSLESKVMEEEIFGPLMPFLEVEDMEEAIRIARSKPKPLALYIFSNDTSVVDHLISQIPSGGVCVNDTLMHFVTTTLPFGGVGASGMGCYHGKWSFETFTHKRAVSRRAPIACLDIVIRYAPYTNFRYQSFKFLAEYFHMYQVPADFSKSARELLTHLLAVVGIYYLLNHFGVLPLLTLQ